MAGLSEQLYSLRAGIPFVVSELLLVAGLIAVLVIGLIRKNDSTIHALTAAAFIAGSLIVDIMSFADHNSPVKFFAGMIQQNDFSLYLSSLFDITGLLIILLFFRVNKQQLHSSEYFVLILSILIGSHFLVMSSNLLMTFIALEIISLSSYLLAGFGFTRRSAEGSLKYFLFGSVASAIMLYGFSLLYGITGTLDFSSAQFASPLLSAPTPLLLMGGLMALAGFLFKISAAPMHLWAPDVYEAAPTPVIAFFSIVPKLAGLGVLTRFVLAVNLFGKSGYDWQSIMGVIAILTLTVGNFSALVQKNPKRLMAYSSIAQSGFLLVGLTTFAHQGVQFMLFYATVYMLMNLLVFYCLSNFESAGITTIEGFKGAGKRFLWPTIFLLVGLISLTGLPPTSGFTAKLFIFTSLWESFQVSGNPVLMWLVLFGLLNTVVALFYYLKIPFYAFLKSGESDQKQNIHPIENLLGLILVVVILILFFQPGLLMGWINKINFVL